MRRQLFRYHLGYRHQCKEPKTTGVGIGKQKQGQQPNKQTRESNKKWLVDQMKSTPKRNR